jgi:hypothetical protein
MASDLSAAYGEILELRWKVRALQLLDSATTGEQFAAINLLFPRS